VKVRQPERPEYSRTYGAI